MHRTANNGSLAERLVDNQAASFSFRDIISRVFLRPKLFLVALLAPTIIATTMTAIVPVEWTASAKILIRYSVAEAGFMKNIVSDSGLGLSGATSAELIKSTPVVERTINNVGIHKEDIYKTSASLIIEKIVGVIYPLLHPGQLFEKESAKSKDPAQAAIERTELINNFKASLDSSAKKTGSGQSIEILEKSSQVPDSMKLDELITVEVKSFNREKVDDIANGLAEAFIDEYYDIYLQEAQRQSEYVDNLIVKEEAELKRIEQASPADLANGTVQTNSSGRELISRDVPILASLATELSIAEASLSRTKQVYAPGSAQVQRISNQVEHLRFMLKKQERIEIGKQLIEQLKAKRFQSLNTEKIYKNRLVPINIIERASEPIQSSAKKVVRLIMSLVIGLILGTIFAISLVVILNVIDPRIHFKKDLEDLSQLPVVGQIPKIDTAQTLTPMIIRNQEKISQGIWQIISRIGQKTTENTAKIITISSPMKGDGSTFCAAALALNLAKNKQTRVCLVDANFQDAGLSKLFHVEKKAGLIEAISDNTQPAYTHLAESQLTLITAGNLAKKTDLGYYTDTLNTVIKGLESDFDFIVIDAGSALSQHESLTFGRIAHEFLLVVSSGVTRKSAISATDKKLAADNIHVNGIIFNFTQEVLPELIYKLL
jgi:Mrp family chromosome partitioning ATPase/capsular polysaccharide biosynthesis protein